ncbi:MAG: extracellular solute-binding protein [Pseudomonadota bacterium]
MFLKHSSPNRVAQVAANRTQTLERRAPVHGPQLSRRAALGATLGLITGLASRARASTDAGSPDAGSPDAGSPDAGSPDAGTLRVLAPADFRLDTAHRRFEAESGLQVELLPLDPHINVATQWVRSRADLCLSPGHQAAFWRARRITSAWQPADIPRLTDVHEPLLRPAMDHWRFDETTPHWLPTTWGAEGIGWRHDMRHFAEPPSYRDLWEGAATGSTLIRPATALCSTVYLLESLGTLPPGSMLNSERDRRALETAYDAALTYMTRYSDRVRLMWNDARTQIEGLLDDGAVLGQTWDTPAFSLQAVDEPVSFQAPREGALCWTSGWMLAEWSRQKPAAHAFLNTSLTPTWAGAATADHGFNATVRGAEQHAPTWYQRAFQRAYAPEALGRLRPVPQQSAWFRRTSAAYTDRFLRALSA